jgi:hypothetical protein
MVGRIEARIGLRVMPEVAPIVAQIRSRRPKLELWLTADSDFGRYELMARCEENGVQYGFLGWPETTPWGRLHELEEAETEATRTGAAARRRTAFKSETLERWSR